MLIYYDTDTQNLFAFGSCFRTLAVVLFQIFACDSFCHQCDVTSNPISLHADQHENQERGLLSVADVAAVCPDAS